MAEIQANGATGTSATIKPGIVAGRRRRLYGHEEHLVMINRDKFDMLESVISDKGLFSHMAAGFIGASIPLGVEMGVGWLINKDPASAIVLTLCAAGTLLGFGSLFLAYRKNKKLKVVRASLFDDQSLIDDRTILEVEDGSRIEFDHLSQSGSDGVQWRQGTE